MIQQFFGRPFWGTFGGLLFVFFIGFFAHQTPISGLLVVSVGLATLALAIWKLEYGMLMAFAEVFAFSHGRVFTLEIAGFPLSSRMAIFLAVMAACLFHYAKNRSISLADQRLYPFYGLFVAVGIGILVGWQKNVLRDVFEDANAYLFAFYIFPMLTVRWTAPLKRLLLQVFAASALFVSTVSFGLLYIFSHLDESVRASVYTYVRDIRLAEAVRLIGDVYRIFLPSQIFVLVFFLILLSASIFFWKSRPDRDLIMLGLAETLAVTVISLSRSFWLSIVVGAVAVKVAVFRIMKPSLTQAFAMGSQGIVVVLVAASLIWITLSIPIPHATNVLGLSSAVSDRAETDAAVTSRWKLLPAMTEQIYSSPIIGHGFGKVVAFESDDPRVREIYPDGKWRTYAFEWGWHDLWLKMGVLGPMAFIWLGVIYGAGLVRGFKKENGWLMIGLFGGLVAVYVTHVFSPYLNHPLGLGYVIFLTPFLTESKKRASSLVSVKDVIEKKRLSASVPAPITSNRVE